MQRSFDQESQVVLTMPILEGLDGVNKMSKSLGNAVGIQEPPLEMYGKLMSISDEMMWRYYELLTDIQLPEIEKMKRESHPMQAKKDLAQRIVTDFHSAEAATKAGEDWAKQFQKDEVPESVEEITVRIADLAPIAEGGVSQPVTWDGSNDQRFVIKTEKLLRQAGLASSGAEAVRKIKERAVNLNGVIVEAIAIGISPDKPITVKIGRKVKRVIPTLP
jgi:tyrosyl-tRNA synthetase